jgi:hypothetical protein
MPNKEEMSSSEGNRGRFIITALTHPQEEAKYALQPIFRIQTEL